MKVVLLKDVKKLGKANDIVNVADGYARNFLLPQKLAEVATEETVRKIEKQKEELSKKNEAELKKAQEIAKQIDGKKVIVEAKGEKGKLFGSIGAKEISEKLKEYDVREENIVLKKGLKEEGETEVLVDFGNGVKAKIILEIKVLS